MKNSILYKFIRPLLAVWFLLTYRPEIINKKVIPKRGRVILAGNHTNNLDVFMLGASTRRPVRFIAKNELMKGIAKPFFKGMGIVPVNRKIKDTTVVPTAVKLLENDSIVGIFPEGTINRTKDIIIPFKTGAIRMAIEAKSPIIPFAIIGKYTKFKKGVKIIFGEVYYPQTDNIEKEIKFLENKVIKLMKKNGARL